MKTIRSITHHAPAFLKAAYANPVALIDHERHIKPGEKYLSYDNGFRVWRMTRERVPIPLGKYKDMGSAIYAARK